MKLQPFFLFLSLLLFILSSCEQAEKSRSYQLVRSDQTLAFTLDDKTKNVTPFLSYYRDKKGKEYIVLQSYSMQSRSNKFYFYDKDSQELAFKIEPEIEGSNGVGRVLGCYIQDWDSLYLTSLFCFSTRSWWDTAEGVISSSCAISPTFASPFSNR